MPNVILIITGKPHRISRYAKTKEEAVKILNELTFLYDTKPRTFEKCTLEQWLRLCLEVYLRPGIKQSTYLPHFTFHALRHTFASRAMEQKMDAKTLSVILGHASVSFTSDTYTHVLTEHKHEGMSLMGELFDVQPPTVCD